MYRLKIVIKPHAYNRAKERDMPKGLLTKSNVRRHLIAARRNGGIKAIVNGAQIIHIGKQWFAVCMSELWGGVSVVSVLGPEEMKKHIEEGENLYEKY